MQQLLIRISLFLFVVFFNNNPLLAQFAISTTEETVFPIYNAPNGKIIHYLEPGKVFAYEERKGKEEGWVQVYVRANYFSLGCEVDPLIWGFIPKKKLLPLEQTRCINPTTFSVQYELVDFESKYRYLKKSSHGDFWSTINGRPYHGSDGELPKTAVKDMQVLLNGKNIPVHQAFYQDIFECDNSFSYYQYKEYYIASQSNSDGAGAYFIVWVFDETGLRQRFIMIP